MKVNFTLDLPAHCSVCNAMLAEGEADPASDYRGVVNYVGSCFDVKNVLIRLRGERADGFRQDLKILRIDSKFIGKPNEEHTILIALPTTFGA